MGQRVSARWLIRLGLLVVLALSCAGGGLLGWAVTSTGALPRLPFAGQSAPTPGAGTSPQLPSGAQSAATSAARAPGDASRNELEAQIEAVYERVGPSVVNITSRSLEYD